MKNVIEQMLAKYELNSDYDRVNALKEIIQEITLSGLSRGGFFKKAAFYGGTALRVFYGLDRFSEDLDFSLIEKMRSLTYQNGLQQLKMKPLLMGLNYP